MTFRDVILKSFLKNIKKYLSYYFSGTFCVAMFFIYSTLMFLDSVLNCDNDYPIAPLFMVSCMIIFAFSIIFMNYAHHMFVRNHKKELGIYMVLGMDETATSKMLAVETAFLGLGSIFSGMLIGTVFARFFQIVIQKLLELDQIQFQIKPQSFAITSIVFSLLYIFNFLQSRYQISKSDLVTIMKEKNKKQSHSFRKADIILFFIGIFLMAFSVVFICMVASNTHINDSLWVVFTFIFSGYIGLILVISCGIKTYVAIFHKKHDYYKKMLYISGIEHKFRQNNRVIIMLAMLASMIVMLVGSSIALVSISGDIAENGNSDLLYMTFAEYDNSRINEIIHEKEIESSNEVVIYCTIDSQSNEMKPILSVSEYNKQMKTNICVTQGQVYHMITSWEPGNMGVKKGDTYTIGVEPYATSFMVCESIKGTWDYTSLFQTKSILIISDQDFERMKPMLLKADVNQIMYKDNWRTLGSLINDVRTELNEKLPNQNMVNSILDIYKMIKSGYSVFLFTANFMCFMFFISTGCVLYFKQFNEIDEEREQYKQLYKIGISDKVVKRSISAKLAVVYFFPLLGTIMGIMISYYLASLFGGDSIIKLFIKKAMIGVVCYAVSQLLFYLFLRVKYLHDVLQTQL